MPAVSAMRIADMNERETIYLVVVICLLFRIA